MTGATKKHEIAVVELFQNLWPVSGSASKVKYSIFGFVSAQHKLRRMPWCQDGCMEQRRRPSATSPRQISLSPSLSHSLCSYVSIYVYVYQIHMNNRKGRPGIPFCLTLCRRVGRAGESCGRVRPARRPISRLCLTATHKHTQTHPHPQATNLAQNSSPKWVQKVPKTGRQICQKHYVFLRKMGFPP